jgi:hypothetical protein
VIEGLHVLAKSKTNPGIPVFVYAISISTEK